MTAHFCNARTHPLWTATCRAQRPTGAFVTILHSHATLAVAVWLLSIAAALSHLLGPGLWCDRLGGAKQVTFCVVQGSDTDGQMRLFEGDVDCTNLQQFLVQVQWFLFHGTKTYKKTSFVRMKTRVFVPSCEAVWEGPPWRSWTSLDESSTFFW